MRRRALVLAACLAASVGATFSSVPEARADERDFPCEGCFVAGDRGGDPKPLLVVLHGDEGGPSNVAGLWTAVAKKKGVIALFPKCPRTEGCTTGSFWRWNGDPSWLLGQVTKLEAAYAVDPKRRYIAGWSGGTTYLTFQFDAWFPTFAAASLTGGGAPGSRCFARAGGACAPVLYRMGAKNPLFDLADGAHQQIAGCGHDVEWNVLPGLNHEAEWTAYTRDAGAILDWLLTKTASCDLPPPPPPTTSSSSSSSSWSSSSSSSSSSSWSSSSSSSPPETPPPPRCQCSLSPTSEAHAVPFALGLAAFAARRRRRR